MKILHTADWHIGQSFHEYDRTYEHQCFLDWLIQTIKIEKIDVLLICGDVFDLSNPAASSIKMFYTFLNRATKANKEIQVIIIAGNHDSASRLESPKPLLESSNIHIVGLLERNEERLIDYNKLVIPLKDIKGETKVWCMAVPFLRMGDYPDMTDSTNSYSEGISAFYRELYEYTLNKKQDGQSVIALGHLHTLNAEVTDMDKAERQIMGGVDCIPTTAFHNDIKFVALGHIHKAQCIGGKESIRYSGSPIPMSFSELNYKHQVIVFEIESENISEIKSIEVPVAVPLLRIPFNHKPLTEVLSELRSLSDDDINPELYPYLEVRVLLKGPEPALRYKIENSLADKKVRLAKIDVQYPSSSGIEGDRKFVPCNNLNELKPLDVFSKNYQTKYNTSVPETILQLFNQVAQEASRKGESE